MAELSAHSGNTGGDAPWRETQRAVLGHPGKPFVQSLHIDLSGQADEPPIPIHLGFRLGEKHLVDLLMRLAVTGVSHVALNLKYSRRTAAEVLDHIGERVIPAIRNFNP
jgi:hypothetical protein